MPIDSKTLDDPPKHLVAGFEDLGEQLTDRANAALSGGGEVGDSSTVQLTICCSASMNAWPDLADGVDDGVDRVDDGVGDVLDEVDDGLVVRTVGWGSGAGLLDT